MMKKYLLLLFIFPIALKAQQIGITIVGNGSTLFIITYKNGNVTKTDTVTINAAPLPLVSLGVINQPDGTWKANWTVGQTFCASAVGKDSLGNVIKGAQFTYTTTDTTVAKVVPCAPTQSIIFAVPPKTFDNVLLRKK